MNPRIAAFIVTTVVAASMSAFGQPTPTPDNYCQAPKLAVPSEAYKKANIEKQPDGTVDLPTVVQTLQQALKCYQQLTGDDPLQPKGLPKLDSVAMDFKTATGKTVGFTFSIFIFKVGASKEKDVTDDITFTYSVPKKVPAFAANIAKPSPPPLYEELVKDVQAAARAAQTQSTVLGKPLSSVKIAVSYGIKFDGNVALSAPIQLVTIGGNGDYNKNNTQTLTLTFSNGAPPAKE